jgi:3-methyladenine DNA glycosylase AlkD
VSEPLQLVVAIESRLRAHSSPERAAGARRYLKSDLEFVGVTTPKFRDVVGEALRSAGPLAVEQLRAAVSELWRRPVFELRAAAVELLDRHATLLEGRDLARVERMLRESRTWALVDWLSTRVAGRLIERRPALADELDRWAADGDFWVRRAALLSLLVPLRRGGGDFERFGRYADAMLEEREFFVRKAIGWVLREVAKKRPGLVDDWLRPRLARASGLTVREAVKYLPPERRGALLELRSVLPRRQSSAPARAAEAPRARGKAGSRERS